MKRCWLALLALALLTQLAFAQAPSTSSQGDADPAADPGQTIVLPTTPPTIESTPLSEEMLAMLEQERQQLAEQERLAEQEQQAAEEGQAQMKGHGEQPVIPTDPPKREGGFWSLDVGSVLLLGAAVWYLVALAGFFGGRGGRGGQGRL